MIRRAWNFWYDCILFGGIVWRRYYGVRIGLRDAWDIAFGARRRP